MSQSEVQQWALLVGFALFGIIVGVLLLLRQRAERASGGAAVSETDWMGLPAAAPEPRADTSAATSARRERRRPEPAPPASTGERASAIRSLLLRAIAERVPAGWSALVLCPPLHRELMTWHVHLVPEVALDLRDGRTVTVAAPRPSHQWQLPGGRVVTVGEGARDPPPTDETLSLRVTGPYLVVAVGLVSGTAPELSARVVTADGAELPQPHAATSDVRAVQAALREAVEQAVGSRMLGAPPAVGYRRASWASHERIWLNVSG